MTTNPTPASISVDDARRIIADHDAALLAEQAEAERRRAAEAERQARRRRAWATAFLADDPDAKLAQARRAAREAKAAVGAALAEAPWFQAIIAWQAAEFDVVAVANQRSNARAIVEGRQESPPSHDGGLVSWLEGRPSFDELLRIIDGTLHEHADHDPMAPVDAYAAAPDDGSDT